MSGPNRRDLLCGSLAAALLGGLGGRAAASGAVGMTLGAPTPFEPGMITAKAKMLAASAYVPPPQVPQPWLDLTYDQYRQIWFDTRNALWRDSASAVQVEFFPAGLYFASPVTIHAVDGAEAREVTFEARVFDKTDKFPDLPEAGMGYSGLRLLGELEKTGTFQEYAVFQGASYFRAIARGQAYGLSARGLAIGTGGANVEEFPFFSEFWVEAADAGSASVRVHALMNSPSVTGAYTFTITKGETTVMDVDARLFPRTEITEVGIAPETSMFLFDQTNRNRFDDFRDAVHDSDGLLMLNGAGEHLWRPLLNPLRLEISAFADKSPRGFGLMQRARESGDFNDLEAAYEKRPSLWVEPMGDWGPGHVILVEIPSDKEIYDNIAAFWRPSEPLAAGSEQRFRYRLHWCALAPVEGPVARAMNTRTGERVFEEGRIFAIDFAPHPALGQDPAQLEARVNVSAGTVASAVVHANPATGGVRLDFTVNAPDAAFYEMRAELWRDGQRVSEAWLYRWIAA